jgi:hypothetical protein
MENAMTTLSRRSAFALSGAAAVAVAAPSMATAQSKCSFPDLAARLARVRERWVNQCNLDQAHDAAQDAFCEKETGLTEAEAREDQCSFPERPEHGPKWRAWWAAYTEYSEAHPDDDPVDEHGCSIAWNEIYDELNPVCREIMQRPAQNAADLGVQVQAFAVSNFNGHF